MIRKLNSNTSNPQLEALPILNHQVEESMKFGLERDGGASSWDVAIKLNPTFSRHFRIFSMIHFWNNTILA